MDPVDAAQTNGDHGGADVTSWVSVCPGGPWNVQLKSRRKGPRCVSTCGDGRPGPASERPRLGSLCRVRVRLKINPDQTDAPSPEEGNEELPDGDVTDVDETSFVRRQDCALQVPLGVWTNLRLGQGQCDITEACLEGMTAGERCEILLTPVGNGPHDSAPHVSAPHDSAPPAAEAAAAPLCATVELHDFTTGKDSWELSPGDKWDWVRSHKERGGARFRSGDVWGAAHSYSRALKLLIPLYCHVGEPENDEPDQEPGQSDAEKRRLPSFGEFTVVKAELHSNLSLCQLKLSQPERARASASKATELDPAGAKAWYRLGRACQTLNELEEAKRAFRKLLELQPESALALKALKEITRREKETNAQLGLRLSKMFS